MKKVLVGLVVLGGLSLPLGASALSLHAGGSQAAGFCSRLPDLEVQIEAAIADREDQLTSDTGSRDIASYTKVAVRDLRNALSDTEDDTVRALKLGDSKRVRTDEERLALSAFDIAIEKAGAIRKSGIESATATYWEKADLARDLRHKEQEELLARFSIDMRAVIDDAKNNCTDDERSGSAQFTYISAVKNVQDGFSKDRSTITSMKERLKSLTLERRKTFVELDEAFRYSIDAAQGALEKSLGK